MEPSTIAALQAQYAMDRADFETFHNFRSMMLQKIQEAIDVKWLRFMMDDDTGLEELTIQEVITKLETKYAQQGALNLRAIKDKMVAPIDGSTPFTDDFARLERHQKEALALQPSVKIDDTELMSTMLSLIVDTGLYPKECKEFNDRPATEQTWAQLKIDFEKAQENKERYDEATTAKTLGFGGDKANAVTFANEEKQSLFRAALVADQRGLRQGVQTLQQSVAALVSTQQQQWAMAANHQP